MEPAPQIEETSDTSSTHSVVDISDKIPDPLQTSLMLELEELRAKTVEKSPTIFRFPLHIRRGREADIKPRVVSIGPFFHGDIALQAMEEQKPKYMSDLLSNSGDDVPPDLLEKIRELETRARECYSETIELGSDDFVRMLLLDSCFIIRFLIYTCPELHGEFSISLDRSIKEIRCDLLLMENQVPFFVLQEVYNIMFRQHPDVYLNFDHILEPFIHLDIPKGLRDKSVPCDVEAYHLLDNYWLRYLHNKNGQLSRRQLSSPFEFSDLSESPDNPSAPVPHRVARLLYRGAGPNGTMQMPSLTNIPSATELHRVAGVVFKKRSDVKFLNGTMEMPSFKMSESRKIILTNLVGYEKTFHPQMRKLSSYMLFMDSLVNTEEDVALLQEFGVLVNGLSSNSCAAAFINEIGDMCTVDYKKHNFEGLFRDVRKYYNSKWIRRFASMRHKYFSSPWAGISVFVGGVFLILTIIQTIFAGVQTF